MVSFQIFKLTPFNQNLNLTILVKDLIYTEYLLFCLKLIMQNRTEPFHLIQYRLLTYTCYCELPEPITAFTASYQPNLECYN